MPIMATTIINSIKVNPCSSLTRILFSLARTGRFQIWFS